VIKDLNAVLEILARYFDGNEISSDKISFIIDIKGSCKSLVLD
jgi:hypothetical protein